MLKAFRIVTSNEKILDITLRNPEKSGFLIRSVNGITPVKASISTSDYATMDGSFYNSSRLEMRNIVFNLVFYGDNIESIRLKSYEFFNIKSKIDIYIYTDTKTVYTKGYVESNDIDVFSGEEGCQISILCPDPYLYSINEDNMSLNSNAEKFYFPFYSSNTNPIVFGEIGKTDSIEIDYDGDYDSGFVSEIYILGSGITDISIENTVFFGDYLNIHYAFNIGDTLKISTEKRNIYAILTRNGVDINIINAIIDSIGDSNFPRIHPGKNNLKISNNLTDPTTMNVNIKFKKIYGGV